MQLVSLETWVPVVPLDGLVHQEIKDKLDSLAHKVIECCMLCNCSENDLCKPEATDSVLHFKAIDTVYFVLTILHLCMCLHLISDSVVKFRVM